MKSKILFESQKHQWLVLGRDSEKQKEVVDTNEYVILSDENVMLLDPGGSEIFSQVLAALCRHVDIEAIKVIVASHQDPDIVSSLAMWLDLCPGVKVFCSRLWTGFIHHFGMGTAMELIGIPDKGMEIPIGNSGNSIFAIPAHFCHSSGNFSFYDPIAEILFSGDIGAALLPTSDTDLFVEDFESHIQYMETFHLRWMPSSAALREWVQRVRNLRPVMICPQHGAIFQGDNAEKLLDWLESLEVGIHDDLSNPELDQRMAQLRNNRDFSV
ncbi:MAG: MBL fold metallo-hydrolase [SAR324 cluster bacterium]|nr:MBL fold metallo-hydrolase [SAR324 cluster bacterium]